MILKDSYCHQIHIIWLGWRPWIVIIHREPVDSWWVAWTLGYKNTVFGDSLEEALKNIRGRLQIKAELDGGD